MVLNTNKFGVLNRKQTENCLLNNSKNYNDETLDLTNLQKYIMKNKIDELSLWSVNLNKNDDRQLSK